MFILLQAIFTPSVSLFDCWCCPFLKGWTRGLQYCCCILSIEFAPHVFRFPNIVDGTNKITIFIPTWSSVSTSKSKNGFDLDKNVHSFSIITVYFLKQKAVILLLIKLFILYYMISVLFIFNIFEPSIWTWSNDQAQTDSANFFPLFSAVI